MLLINKEGLMGDLLYVLLIVVIVLLILALV